MKKHAGSLGALGILSLTFLGFEWIGCSPLNTTGVPGQHSGRILMFALLTVVCGGLSMWFYEPTPKQKKKHLPPR
jgi:hypothetical protein